MRKTYWKFRNDITCTRCGFGSKFFRSDRHTCKDCCSDIKKAWYKNLPAERKAHYISRLREWNKKNPEKKRVHDKVNQQKARDKAKQRMKDKFIGEILKRAIEYDPNKHDLRSILYIAIRDIMKGYRIAPLRKVVV